MQSFYLKKKIDSHAHGINFSSLGFGDFFFEPELPLLLLLPLPLLMLELQLLDVAVLVVIVIMVVAVGDIVTVATVVVIDLAVSWEEAEPAGTLGARMGACLAAVAVAMRGGPILDAPLLVDVVCGLVMAATATATCCCCCCKCLGAVVVAIAARLAVPGASMELWMVVTTM